MAIKNVEIKARCPHPGKIRTILKQQNADFKGTDHQVDTYFNVDEGRLKLREGTIENSLIFYRRPDTAFPKLSDIYLVSVANTTEMKNLLGEVLGIQIIVEKHREIYFIENVKFHIDKVEKLGSFVEIEAIDKDESIGEANLREQCDYYMNLFGIEQHNLVAKSYSDMLEI